MIKEIVALDEKLRKTRSKMNEKIKEQVELKGSENEDDERKTSEAISRIGREFGSGIVQLKEKIRAAKSKHEVNLEKAKKELASASADLKKVDGENKKSRIGIRFSNHAMKALRKINVSPNLTVHRSPKGEVLSVTRFVSLGNAWMKGFHLQVLDKLEIP